ncbi:MAG: hypothetical protein E6I48_00720 [Chloroflexi bacterium]|nr:MAG: hypothetical protein E6I48_00720 [Chloroflexota bacterium]
MRTGGIVGAIASAIRSVARRIGALARWSFESDAEELPPLSPPQPGPPHGPIPAIDLRREPRHGEIPRSAGPPPR